MRTLIRPFSITLPPHAHPPEGFCVLSYRSHVLMTTTIGKCVGCYTRRRPDRWVDCARAHLNAPRMDDARIPKVMVPCTRTALWPRSRAPRVRFRIVCASTFFVLVSSVWCCVCLGRGYIFPRNRGYADSPEETEQLITIQFEVTRDRKEGDGGGGGYSRHAWP